MIKLIHMFQTIMAIVLSMIYPGQVQEDTIIYCSSCGEPFKIEYMTTCQECGNWICPICHDSYIYTLGPDIKGCFTCNDQAPMGILPPDYDYNRFN